MLLLTCWAKFLTTAIILGKNK